VQVGVKSHYQGASGQISLYFGNKHSEALQRVVCNVPPTPAFLFQLGAVPAVIEPKKQVRARAPAAQGTRGVVRKVCSCGQARQGAAEPWGLVTR
jgi:hypothetical protein